MATKSEKAETCGICLKRFIKPRILPCSHVFCTVCLNAHVSKSNGGDRIDLFSCPTCRHEISLPEGGTMCFPTLPEVQRVANWKELCEVCEDGFAFDFCFNCDQNFCRKCSSIHQRMKSTKDHTVTKLADLKKLPGNGESFANLRRELQEVVSENRELKQRVQKLEENFRELTETPVVSRLLDNKKEMQILKQHLGTPMTTSRIAFSVYPSKHLDNLRPNQQLMFDKVDYISGGGYDVHTGVYTCPVSGLYHLTLSLLSSHTKTLFYGEIVVAGSSLGTVFTSFGHFGTHTNIAHCKKGQTVILRRRGSDGSGNLHAGKYTNFVGFLLWEDPAGN